MFVVMCLDVGSVGDKIVVDFVDISRTHLHVRPTFGLSSLDLEFFYRRYLPLSVPSHSSHKVTDTVPHIWRNNMTGTMIAQFQSHQELPIKLDPVSHTFE